jgi:hypothetical protein
MVNMRLLLVFGSLLLLLGCGSSTQTKESKWPNGKTREVWLEDGDGYRHGLASTYYENGKLQTQVTFHRDYPHGPFKMWDREGNLIASGEFKEGQKWNGRFIRGDMALGRVEFEEWENGVMVSTPTPPPPPRPPAPTPPPGTEPAPGQVSGSNEAVPVPPPVPAPPVAPIPPAEGEVAPASPPPPPPAPPAPPEAEVKPATPAPAGEVAPPPPPPPPKP